MRPLDALLQKLLLMSLSLEQAFRSDCQSEADGLLEQRAHVLEELQRFAPLSRSETLDKILDCDRRISDLLEGGRQAIGAELRKGNVGARARRAYGSQAA